MDNKNFRDLSWLSLPDRVMSFRMSHLFRIRHKLAPVYLLPNFKSVSDAHTHNTRGSNFNFHMSRELSLSPNGFAFTAIKQWNALPNDLKSITDFYRITDVYLTTVFTFLRLPNFYHVLNFYKGPCWKKVVFRLSQAIPRDQAIYNNCIVNFCCFVNKFIHSFEWGVLSHYSS